MGKIVYSSLYDEYLVIYKDLLTGKSTVEHCGKNPENAKAFKEALVTSIPMWYNNY